VLTRRRLLGAFAPAFAKATAGKPRPNIVWIWADNLAWQDLSCYGNTRARTPFLDRLAGEGVRFTQYYVAHTVCSPSRAALLTGRQPFRTGVVDVLRPDSPTGLASDEITIAALLRRAGYRTMAIGKWHLGDKPHHLPTAHGFEHYFGMPYSMDMLPAHLYRDAKIIEDLGGPNVETITERYVDEAIGFLRLHRERPLFLYVSHTLPHPPIHLPARARTPGRAVYDDAIEHLDRETGRLLAALEELGLRDRTLVFFSSDNGPMAPGGQTGGLRGRIRDAYEGGVRVPLLARWPGRIPPGRVVSEPAIAYDLFPTLARAAGVPVPGGRGYDGQDITALLEGKGEFRRRAPFFWVYLDRVTALRDGPWKLHVASRETPLAEPELYNVEEDPGESRNLAPERPEVVGRLRRSLEQFQAGVPKVWSLQYPVRDARKLPSGVRR
jgi:arylsulfatase A-like enzyme